MYLESIFVGSEDIRKQLPSESSLFDQVNADWISTTARMEAAGTAYKADDVPADSWGNQTKDASEHASPHMRLY